MARPVKVAISPEERELIREAARRTWSTVAPDIFASAEECGEKKLHKSDIIDAVYTDLSVYGRLEKDLQRKVEELDGKQFARIVTGLFTDMVV